MRRGTCNYVNKQGEKKWKIKTIREQLTSFLIENGELKKRYLKEL